MHRSVQGSGRRVLPGVARRYEREGFDVIVEPRGADLPEFLAGSRPDLIARAAGSNVIVAVRSRDSMAEDEGLTSLAGLLENRPGWRLDLIVVRSRADFEARHGVEPLAEDDARTLLARADDLLDQGVPHAALLLVVAAAGAALGHIARREELPAGRESPGELLRTLVTLGVVDRSAYEPLRLGIRLGGRLVRGSKATGLDPAMVKAIRMIVEDLLK